MKKGLNIVKLTSHILLFFTGTFTASAFAADIPSAAVSQAVKTLLPGSTEPGVLSNYLSTPARQAPSAGQPIRAGEQKAPSPLGPEAEKIKFKLTKIILEDNHVYSDKQLTELYKNKINKQISVAELQNIVQSITNYYRNNGYILSRAILPPQHVSNGTVRVKIIEGYIEGVRVIGVPKGARKMIQAYGDKIAQSRPLQLKVMEHYLRLANEIPGAQVKAVLEPSKTHVGASDLNLSSQEQTLAGSFSYDNYGTRYIGPNQDTLNASVNSIFVSGDSTRATYATTTRPKQLKFYDFSYQAPLWSNGLTGTIGKNYSGTLPGMNLALIDINGISTTYYALLQYPWIRSRARNLTLDAGFNYMNSDVKSFDFLLYEDRIRSVRAGANYDFADRFNGSNTLGAHIEQGFNIFGASNNPDSLTSSRFYADGIFTKLALQGARLQPIKGPFSLFVLANYQYSFEPLLAAEQFAFGGSQLGRGYDPAEIIGDRGLSGTVELRMDIAPGWAFLAALQPYLFYDAGVIWNIKDIPGVKNKQSATSTGIGTRFILTKNLSGNLMIAQPLTKSVAAQELIGRGRCPRGFFSIVAAI